VLFAARLVSELIKISDEMRKHNSILTRQGRSYDRTVSTCEFSCLNPAEWELFCQHGIEDSDDDEFDAWNPGRNACRAHFNIKSIRCDCAGKKGCRVVSKRKLELSETEVLFDEEHAFDAVKKALIGGWGEFGPVLEAYKLSVEARQAETEAALSAVVKPVLHFKHRFVMGRNPLWSTESSVAAVSAVDRSECEVSEKDQKVESPTFLSPEAAVSAVGRRKRGVRGGKHVRHLKPGYCYLKLFHRSVRPYMVKLLERYPKLPDVLEYESVIDKPRMKLQKVNGGFHVRYEPNWNLQRQLRLLQNSFVNFRVGAEEFPEEMVLAALDFVEENCHFIEPITYKNMMIPDIEPIIKPVPVEPTPVLVKGEGSCWRKIPRITQYIDFDKTDVSVVLLIDVLGKMPRMGNWGIKIEKQSDGDLHIVETIYMGGRALARLEEPGVMWADDLKGWLQRFWDNHLAKFDKENVNPNALGGGKVKAPIVGAPAAVSAFDSAVMAHGSVEVRRDVDKVTGQKLNEAAEDLLRRCPYFIPPHMRTKMNELGLPYTATMGRQVDHPVHATLRRWEIEQAARMIRSDVTIVSMKIEHFEMFETMFKQVHSEKYKCTLVNPIIEVKDFTRFAGNYGVPEEVFGLPKITTPSVMFHESGHFASEAALAVIANLNPDVKFFYASSIFPMLALSLEASPEPLWCEWMISPDRKTLTYIPEGDTGGHYDQPFNVGLLLAKSITSSCGKVRLTGGVVASKGNTHIQVFTRYELQTPKCLVFSMQGVMDLPRLYKNQPHIRVTIKDYVALYQYGQVLIGAKEKDFSGKLRQLWVDRGMYFPVDHQKWLVSIMEVVCQISLVHKGEPIYFTGLGSEIWHYTLGNVVRVWEQLFSARYARRNARLIRNPRLESLVPLVDVKVILRPNTDGFYMTSWSLPADQKWAWMDGTAMWHWLWTKCGPKVSDSGQFHWLGASWMAVEAVGLSEIHRRQVADFRANFPSPATAQNALERFQQDRNLANRSLFVEEEPAAIQPTSEGGEYEAVDNKIFQVVKKVASKGKKRSSEVDGDEVESVSTLPKYEGPPSRPDSALSYYSNVTKPPSYHTNMTEEELEVELEKILVHHCDECAPYHVMTAMRPTLSPSDYLDHCEFVHEGQKILGEYDGTDEWKVKRKHYQELGRRWLDKRAPALPDDITDKSVQRQEEVPTPVPTVNAKPNFEPVPTAMPNDGRCIPLTNLVETPPSEAGVLPFQRLIVEERASLVDSTVASKKGDEPFGPIGSSGFTARYRDFQNKKWEFQRHPLLKDFRLSSKGGYVRMGDQTPNLETSSCASSMYVPEDPKPLEVVKEAEDELAEEVKVEEIENSVDLTPQMFTPGESGPDEHWDKRALQWTKLSLKRPQGLGINRRTVGASMWNTYYPLTTDRRVKLIPFADVVEYPKLEYPEQDCLLVAVGEALRRPTENLLLIASKTWPASERDRPDLPDSLLHLWGCHFLMQFKLFDGDGNLLGVYGVRNTKVIAELTLDRHHFSLRERPRVMLIRSVQPSRPMNALARKLVNEVSDSPLINWAEWHPENYRANQFVRAMLKGTTGRLPESELNQDALKQWDLISTNKQLSSEPRYLAVVAGHPGCRKSSFAQRILKKKVYQEYPMFNVSVPTTVLEQDWRDKLDAPTPVRPGGKGMPGGMVSTYETTLAKGCWAHVMMQDEDKFPKGYLALKALLFPQTKYHVMFCDPYQSERHEVNPDCLLNDADIPGEAKFYFQYCQQYFIGTWRFGPNIANFWRMPSYNNHRGGFHFTRKALVSWQSLMEFFPKKTPSELEALWRERKEFYAAHFASVWAGQMREGEFNTYAGSQGLTAPLAILEVDSAVLRGGMHKLIYTAMTRAKDLIIWVKYAENGMDQRYEAEHPIFKKLKYYRERYLPGKVVPIHPDHTVDMFELEGKLPGHMKMVLSGPPSKLTNWTFVSRFWPVDQLDHYVDPDVQVRRGGARLAYADPVYVDQPDFKVFIDETVEPEIRDALVVEPVLTQTKVRTSLPPVDLQALKEQHDSDVNERYTRELSNELGFSEQLPDLPIRRVDANKLENQQIESMFGHTALSKRNKRKLWVEVTKRLPITERVGYADPVAVNYGLLQKSQDVVSFLEGVRQRIVKLPSSEENYRNFEDEKPIGNDMWEAWCRYVGWNAPVSFDVDEYARAIQTFQERRGERSEAMKKMSLPRADPRFEAILTAKTQWKLKEETSGKAKPLQPLFVAPDRYLFKLGAVGVYLLDKVLEHLPDYVYIHAKASIEEMQARFQMMLAEGPYEMSDVSGMDASVTGHAVQLMVRLMEHFGIPDDLIEYYVDSKCNFKTKSFYLKLMTLTGELFTYLCNTLRTGAKEALQFDMRPGWPMALGGDDLIRRSGLVESHSWLTYRNLLRIEEKREVSERGSFVSFSIVRGVCYKNPIILYRRLRGHLARGKGNEIALGYFEMFARNYSLGEALLQYMTAEEVEHQSAVNRIMFNLRQYGVTIKLPWDKAKVGVDELAADTLPIFEVAMNVDFADPSWGLTQAAGETNNDDSSSNHIGNFLSSEGTEYQ